MDIFAELEENNLALIQNCQETEETLEELKQKINETESRMYAVSRFVDNELLTRFLACREKETQSLKQQIDSLNLSISREEDKAKMLEEKARYNPRSLYMHSETYGFPLLEFLRLGTLDPKTRKSCWRT